MSNTLNALAMTPNIDLPRTGTRYDLPQQERLRVFGLGCLCDAHTCECNVDRRMDFVSLSDIKASFLAEVPVHAMTPSEYQAWFAESEVLEYELAGIHTGNTYMYGEASDSAVTHTLVDDICEQDLGEWDWIVQEAV